MINIISKLFYFLLFFIICIGLMELFFFLILKKKKLTSGVKMQVFGILMELNNITIFALSTILVKFLWTIFLLINGRSLHTIDLIILVFLSIVFGITSLSFKNGILETISRFYQENTITDFMEIAYAYCSEYYNASYGEIGFFSISTFISLTAS